ncbi:MAG: RDD family protein, partial [Pseudomonadota bacterium]
LYDSFLIAGLLLIVFALALASRMGQPLPTGLSGYSLLIVLVPWAFYCGFWINGGQTLGMRAWKIKVQAANARSVNLSVASLRFAASILSTASLGMGFLWMLIDKDGRSWHDRLSGTQIIQTQRR